MPKWLTVAALFLTITAIFVAYRVYTFQEKKEVEVVVVEKTITPIYPCLLSVEYLRGSTPETIQISISATCASPKVFAQFVLANADRGLSPPFELEPTDEGKNFQADSGDLPKDFPDYFIYLFVDGEYSGRDVVSTRSAAN